MSRVNLLFGVEKRDGILDIAFRNHDVQQVFFDPINSTFLVAHEKYGYFLYELKEDSLNLIGAFVESELRESADMVISFFRFYVFVDNKLENTKSIRSLHAQRFCVFVDNKLFCRAKFQDNHQFEIIDFNKGRIHYITVYSDKNKMREIGDMRVSKDGRYVAIRNRADIYVWDVESKSVIYKKRSVVKKRDNFGPYAIIPLFSPDSNFLGHIDPYGVHIVDLRQPKKRCFVFTDDFMLDRRLTAPYIPKIITWSADSCYLLIRTSTAESWMIDIEKTITSGESQISINDVGYRLNLDEQKIIRIDKEDVFFVETEHNSYRLCRAKTSDVQASGVIGASNEFCTDVYYPTSTSKQLRIYISPDKKYLVILNRVMDFGANKYHVGLHTYDLQETKTKPLRKEIVLFSKETKILGLSVDHLQFLPDNNRYLLSARVTESEAVVGETAHWMLCEIVL